MLHPEENHMSRNLCFPTTFHPQPDPSTLGVTRPQFHCYTDISAWVRRTGSKPFSGTIFLSRKHSPCTYVCQIMFKEIHLLVKILPDSPDLTGRIEQPGALCCLHAVPPAVIVPVVEQVVLQGSSKGPLRTFFFRKFTGALAVSQPGSFSCCSSTKRSQLLSSVGLGIHLAKTSLSKQTVVSI